jgi:hypothetical protein
MIMAGYAGAAKEKIILLACKTSDQQNYQITQVDGE